MSIATDLLHRTKNTFIWLSLSLIIAFAALFGYLLDEHHSSGLVSTTKSGETVFRKFMIYYGWYNSGKDGTELRHQLDSILKAKPDFVISPLYNSAGEANLLPKIISEFHENGIKAVTYVATNHSNRDIHEVLAEIKLSFGSGADGIMLDEVSLLTSNSELRYYGEIYKYAKSFGNKTVIANPGTVSVSEQVMQVSDIVSFEHEWPMAAKKISWFSKYPADRYMGISSNDIRGVMGYPIDGDRATLDTIEAWQEGIGYHFSTDVYTDLPYWLHDYERSIDEYRGAAQVDNAGNSLLKQLGVNTTDTNGNNIEGLWIQVERDSLLVAKGYSQATFKLPQGSYDITASSYQNLIFARWLGDKDQGSASIRVQLTNNTMATAVYSSNMVHLKLEAADISGKPIQGIKVLLNGDNGFSKTVTTPAQASLPAGEYTVSTADKSLQYQFHNWQNKDSENPLRMLINSDNTLVSATFNDTLLQTITQTAQECKESDNTKLAAAAGFAENGPLATMLEIFSYNNPQEARCPQ